MNNTLHTHCMSGYGTKRILCDHTLKFCTYMIDMVSVFLSGSVDQRIYIALGLPSHRAINIAMHIVPVM